MKLYKEQIELTSHGKTPSYFDITPQVKLTEKLPTVLPKAGSTIFFSFMGIVLVIAVACGIKYVVVKNSMK